MHTGFWWRNLEERDRLENLGIDISITLKLVLKIFGWNGEDWVHVTRDRDICRIPMDTEF